MRNPKRIPYVLRELEKIWEKYPDYRLGQLIFNIAGRDPFFIEDYDTVRIGSAMAKVDIDTLDFPDYYLDYNSPEESIINENE